MDTAVCEAPREAPSPPTSSGSIPLTQDGRTCWWKPLVIIGVPPLALLILHVLALTSRGIEAPVAFHIDTTVLFPTGHMLLADGNPFAALERATGTGDTRLLMLAAVNGSMVVLVWLRERRGRVGAAGPPSATPRRVTDWEDS